MVTITKYVWDTVSDCVLSELDENNAVTAVYTNEPQQYGGVLSQRRGNTSHFHHHDALGSTRFLTDSSGNVTDTYLNDAWGNSVESTGTTVNPFRWVGKYGYYADDSIGQVYVRARMYQPTVARWTSAILTLLPAVWYRHVYANINLWSGTLMNPFALAPPVPSLMPGDPQLPQKPVHPQVYVENPREEYSLDGDDVMTPCESVISYYRNEYTALGSNASAAVARKCNVNVFCGDCGTNGEGNPLGGNTFFDPAGRLNICLYQPPKSKKPKRTKPMTPQEYRRLEAMLLHELVHADQLLLQFKAACRNDCHIGENPIPPNLDPPVFPTQQQLNDACERCKFMENVAYTEQANYLFPTVLTTGEARRAFIAAGICFSCRHLCVEFQGAPCPEFP